MSLAAGDPVEGPTAGASVPEVASSPDWSVGARRSPAWVIWVGVVLALAAGLPPLGIWARRWVVGEAFQFVLFSYVVPPLLVLGLAPATRQRLVAWPVLPRRRGASPSRSGATVGERPSPHRFDPLEDRPGRRAADPAAARAWGVLVVFVAIVVFWRSSPLVDALAHHELLVLLEAVSLLLAGCALWLNLLDPSGSVAERGRPRRMAIAAVAMWAIWVLAFVIGFANRAMFPAYHHQPGSGLSTIGDQELAVAVLFAIPGFALVPVVFANFTAWLRPQEGTPTGSRGAANQPAP